PRVAEVARDVERVWKPLDRESERLQLGFQRVGGSLREVRVGALIIEIVDNPRSGRHGLALLRARATGRALRRCACAGEATTIGSSRLEPAPELLAATGNPPADRVRRRCES